MKLESFRLVAVAFCALPLGLFVACPGDDSDGGATGGGGGVGGLADADTGSTWDPVWHETTPKGWATVGPEKNPNCGPGCRVALNVPIATQASYGHAYTTDRVLAISKDGLAFAAIGSSQTSIIPHPADAPRIQESMWGDYVSSLRAFGAGDGQVEVTSVLTGETKVAFRYTPAEAGDYSVNRTALNPKYVFWEMFGVTAMDLQSGEAKTAGTACYTYWPTDDGLVCENGTMSFYDVASGKVEPFDSANELQTDSNIAPDRKKVVWVDYRDPPGPGSTKDFFRSGGEIYLRDLEQGSTKRLTFDSPDTPRGKVQSAVGENVAVWNEVPLSASDLNPLDRQELSAAAKALATLDLVSGERCQLVSNPPLVLGYKSVHGRHVYAAWLETKVNEVWLVDVDLDDPALQWQCTTPPG